MAKIDYNEVDDSTLRAFLRDYVTAMGVTARSAATQFGVPYDRARRLLTDMKRRKFIHIKKWLEQSDGKYIAVYVSGRGKNALKPCSQFKSMSPEELHVALLPFFPTTRGALSPIVGLSASGLIPILNTMVKKGLIVQAPPPPKSHRIVFHRAGEYDGEIYEEEIAIPDTKRIKPLTLPWEGYNKHPHDAEFYTTWRHSKEDLKKSK